MDFNTVLDDPSSPFNSQLLFSAWFVGIPEM